MRQLSILFLVFAFAACHQPSSDGNVIVKPQPPEEKRVEVSYHLLFPKDSISRFLHSLDSTTKAVVANVNRADAGALLNFDTIVVPNDLRQSREQYFPFPFHAAFLAPVHKVIFFSYPAEAFAAYEDGRLIRTGPSNMGRKHDPTPTGLFYTNWKAEQTTSTFNDEWDLKWNFNIINDLGVGFHEYALPGYPASHSCLRLHEDDAEFLYNWADEWKTVGKDSIAVYGTPVVVFGSYDFSAPRPWLALARDPNSLTISETDLEKTGSGFLADILAKQKLRDSSGVR